MASQSTSLARVPMPDVLGAMGAVGLLILFAMLFISLLRVMKPRPGERWDVMIFTLVAALPVFGLAIRGLTWLGRVERMRYDQYLYAFDQVFGLHSFDLGKFCNHHPVLVVVLEVAYYYFPFAQLNVIMAYVWSGDERETFFVLKTLVLNEFMAVPFYVMFPVSGPAYVFPTFPVAPGAITPHIISLSALPNGVPSVHTSTAILLLWFCRKWKIGAALASIFLLLTIAATLGLGEHYLFDLLAAVPYAWGVLRLARFRMPSNVEPEPCTNSSTTAGAYLEL